MSILDIFTVKTDLVKVFNADNIDFLQNIIVEKIKAEAKKKILGEEKMQHVIDYVVDAIEAKIHSDNKIVQWIIDNILVKNIRQLIQIAYNNLKEIVEKL